MSTVRWLLFLVDLGFPVDSLNGFFILARTIGLIGHWTDQKRQGSRLIRLFDYLVRYGDPEAPRRSEVAIVHSIRRANMLAEHVKMLYAAMPAKLDAARKKFGRPLTLAEKLLVSHADDFETQAWDRGKAQLLLRPDRVAMQDATAQMAMLQFIQANKPRVAVPSTIHCDHLIRAEVGADNDLLRANEETVRSISSLPRRRRNMESAFGRRARELFIKSSWKITRFPVV